MGRTIAAAHPISATAVGTRSAFPSLRNDVGRAFGTHVGNEPANGLCAGVGAGAVCCCKKGGERQYREDSAMRHGLFPSLQAPSACALQALVKRLAGDQPLGPMRTASDFAHLTRSAFAIDRA
jgi:hypothetical protein